MLRLLGSFIVCRLRYEGGEETLWCGYTELYERHHRRFSRDWLELVGELLKGIVRYVSHIRLEIWLSQELIQYLRRILELV